MPRTPAVTVPNRMALPSANRAPIWNASLPGLVTIKTPRKPTTRAMARAGPTASFRKIAEASVANSGEEKLIAVALASGIMLKAISSRLCEVVCEALRSRCAPGRLVRNTSSPYIGRMNTAQATSPPKGAEEQHLADRIEVDQPFRSRAGEREQHGRGHHVADGERNALLAALRDARFARCGLRSRKGEDR